MEPHRRGRLTFKRLVNGLKRRVDERRRRWEQELLDFQDWASGDRARREHQEAWHRGRVQRIADSPLFDLVWYRAQNPDIADEPDPAHHYLMQGFAEGRSPGPNFDGEWYLAQHPDVAFFGENPLLHYIDTGQAEGRDISPVRETRLPRRWLNDATYAEWCAVYDTLHAADSVAILAAIAAMPTRPSFAVVVPECDPAAAGIEAQLYPHWRMVTKPDPAGADFVVFLHAGVQLAETALFEFAAMVQDNPTLDLLYADEDRLSAPGIRCEPWFKPDWDPDMMLACNLLGSGFVLRASVLQQIGAGIGVDAIGLGAAMAVPASRIGHVPAVLFHASEPPAVAASAVQDVLGGQGTVESAPLAPTYLRIRHPLPQLPPLVSIIIPTRDRAELLERCVQGLLHRTAYAAIEVLIVDNDSAQWRTRRLFRRLRADPRVRIQRYRGAFNWSAINNAAAREACGEILLFLNNDIEIIEPDWLHELVSHVLRPDVGLVGAKLLYPDRRVQHAGMLIPPDGLPTHLMRFAAETDPGYFGQLATVRSVAAVTGACAALRRTVFETVGGFEAEALRVAYNDVDFGLRVRAAGYRVVCTPHAVLLHLESASRGRDETAAAKSRFLREWEYMQRTWGDLVSNDPYLNQNLTVVGEKLALASPPRYRRPWRRVQAPL